MISIEWLQITLFSLDSELSPSSIFNLELHLDIRLTIQIHCFQIWICHPISTHYVPHWCFYFYRWHYHCFTQPCSKPMSDGIFQRIFFANFPFYTYRTIDLLIASLLFSGLYILKLISFTDLRFILLKYGIMSLHLNFIHCFPFVCIFCIWVISIDSFHWLPFLLSMGHVFLFLHMSNNFGLYPGYCKWHVSGILDSVMFLQSSFGLFVCFFRQ
jgi:hypothetical protein